MTVTWPRRLSDIAPTPDRYAAHQREGHFQRTSITCCCDVKTLEQNGSTVSVSQDRLLYIARIKHARNSTKNMGASTAPPRRAYVQALDQGA